MNQNTTSMPTCMPLRVKNEAVKHLSSLTEFHGIPDASLIRLAKRRTGLKVPDRWVAIALILSNRMPIAVADLKERPQVQAREAPAPPKLTVIRGGRIGR
jgi:hypothetical protein